MDNIARISTVIVNYKTPQLVIDCIESFKNELNVSTDRIVIVDNNSGEEDISKLENYIHITGSQELISLVKSKVNGGFSHGNNLGIREIEASYYLLTNSDTVFPKGVYTSLCKLLKKHTNAGIISPRLLTSAGNKDISCFNFHSPVSEFITSAGTAVISSLFSKYEVPLKPVDTISHPEWTSFASVLIKRDVIQKTGFLDEGYFMYYEDVDYCRRARSVGFDIVNDPSVQIIHLNGMSSGVGEMELQRKRLPEYYYKSRARYYRKFYGICGPIIANICWTAGRSISKIKEVVFNKKQKIPDFQGRDIWIK